MVMARSSKAMRRPVAGGDAGGDVVVATAQVLHEGVTGGEGASWAVTLQPAHRPEPGLQPPVVCLDRVVRIVPGGVQGPTGSARRGPAGNRARGRWGPRPGSCRPATPGCRSAGRAPGH